MSLLTPTTPPTPDAPKPAAPASGAPIGGGAAVPPVPPTPSASRLEAASNILSNLRVSLMPNELEGRPPANVGRGLLLLAIVVVAEIAVIGFLYFLVAREVGSREREQAAVTAETVALENDISKLEAASGDAVAYAYQVGAAKLALDKHAYWTALFAFLEKTALPSVQYRSFSGDVNSGIITLDCVGQTYRDVAEQIVSLREHPLVLDVRSTSAAAQISATGDISGVSFSMVLKVKPETWARLASATADASAPVAAPVVGEPVSGISEPAAIPAQPVGSDSSQPVVIPGDAAPAPVTSESPAAPAAPEASEPPSVPPAPMFPSP